MSTRQITFPVQGMTGVRCAEKIEAHLTRVEGVAAARVNYATEHATITYDPARTRTNALVSAVRAAGFDTPLERTTLYAGDCCTRPRHRVSRRS